ncbi:MAG: polynucleotide adenylyltransferase PcnB [Dissulfurimicrobium sp.]|uniref:polynucleotide adenylyltransferase PcnB n=1 Tax=Dissulfurimicrobium TaxID=1769732 RepID=UPI001EDC550F|nr:polynucleotide adenylyltransferase PcnB [Dissulfurimicrobium hydrothermale]UKL13601.1 polynucleotide adenylyltransferase PcnB [Dissulfurimicrobium hydrothermale]
MKGSRPKPRLIQPDLFGTDERPGPFIIPRPEHCLSRKDVDREALKVLYRLKDHGFIAYLVGGSVRDLLIGKRPKDFDVGTNATPEEIKRLFPHSRIIGRRFRLVHVYFKGGKVIEVSTFRQKAEYDAVQSQDSAGDDGDNIFGTPQEDAMRRDLTINGLFYNIADFSIIDYVGGMADLKAGIIRTIGDPERRFLKDPVRMLRAIRHAARTGFAIEKATWDAILIHKDMIRLCAVPRVRDEWLKDLHSGASWKWAELLFESGLFSSIFPNYFKGIKEGDRGLAKTLLSGLLSWLDKAAGGDKKPTESFILALFAYPRLHVAPGWRSLYSERIRWPVQETRDLLNETIAPYDFKKSVRDEAAQILSGLWPIIRCLEIGNWPKRVYCKSRFADSVLLYDLIQEQLGLPAIGPNPHLNPKYQKEAQVRRKRRRKRPKREKEVEIS